MHRSHTTKSNTTIARAVADGAMAVVALTCEIAQAALLGHWDGGTYIVSHTNQRIILGECSLGSRGQRPIVPQPIGRARASAGMMEILSILSILSFQ